MKRKRKQYSKPKRPFNKARIDDEAGIKKEFGLKNKKEIWRAEAKVKSMREKAKKLISANSKEQEALFERLRKVGLNVNSIADILSLDKTDYLKRRLQTVMINKRLATTPKSARQLITHKKVLVDGKVVDSPSYVVSVELEKKISVKPKKKKPVKAPKLEEKPAESSKDTQGAQEPAKAGDSAEPEVKEEVKNE